MHEKWSHRADLAEAAISERHAQRLWWIPGTNLAVVAWPARHRDKVFFRWHYWWQAHYLDCLVDAATRRATPARLKTIQATVRGVQVRNLQSLTKNKYFDDKSWMALALGRVAELGKVRGPAAHQGLCGNIAGGCDPVVGVVPWRENETFFNAPTNGPAAIMLARTGRVAQARQLVDWMIDSLENDRGLIIDGVRMAMHDPEPVTAIYTYNQGVVIGACVEIARALGEVSCRGVAADGDIRDDVAGARECYAGVAARIIHAVARDLTDNRGVVVGDTGGGDGGLFKGVLMRYLADAAIRLPGDDEALKAARSIAARMVLRSADSVWAHRLEVDGLPVFSADWSHDAQLPRNAGTVASSLAGAVNGSSIPERDLSVQLSGWMLMEAAARVTAHQEGLKVTT